MNRSTRSPIRPPRWTLPLLVGASTLWMTGCNSRVDLQGPGGGVRVNAGAGGANVDIRGPGGSIRVDAGRGGANVRVRSNGGSLRLPSGYGRTPMPPPSSVRMPPGFQIPPGLQIDPSILQDPMVRSALTPAQLAELERQLAAQGKLPAPGKPPAQPLPPIQAPTSGPPAGLTIYPPGQLAGLPPGVVPGPGPTVVVRDTVQTIVDPDLHEDPREPLGPVNPGDEDVPIATGPDSGTPSMPPLPGAGAGAGAGAGGSQDAGAQGYEDLHFAFSN